MNTSDINKELLPALTEYLLGIGDDELILGHRNSEWCGHAPILEEDIAFANIALDEIGHATVWYRMISDLIGQDEEAYPDKLVFWREPGDFRNIQMVELPNGDWAFSILRQYLFDSMEMIRLSTMLTSEYKPISEAAAKIQQEELYHHRHTSLWVKRLGMGTEESHRRMQNALDELWVYAMQMFVPINYEKPLHKAKITPDIETLEKAWLEEVPHHLISCGLKVPKTNGEDMSRHQHTGYQSHIIAELQSVARSDPQADW